MKKKKGVAQKLIKFKRTKLSYNSLFYEILIDLGSGKLHLNDDKFYLNKIKQDVKRYPSVNMWYALCEKILDSESEWHGNKINTLAYKYLLKKARNKFIDISKESQKINQPSSELVGVYISALKQKQMTMSLEKILNFGKSSGEINKNRKFQRMSTLGVNTKNLGSRALKLAQENEVDQKKSC